MSLTIENASHDRRRRRRPRDDRFWCATDIPPWLYSPDYRTPVIVFELPEKDGSKGPRTIILRKEL